MWGKWTEFSGVPGYIGKGSGTGRPGSPPMAALPYKKAVDQVGNTYSDFFAEQMNTKKQYRVRGGVFHGS